MTDSSKNIFDSIRVSGSRGKKKTAAAAPKRTHAMCQWKGCDKPGGHKAPMGRGRDGQFFDFCMDHVRQYNSSYNYFDGMTDDEVATFQKDSITGHRPTWTSGANSSAHATTAANRWQMGDGEAQDPHDLLKDRQAQREAAPKKRHMHRLEKKALEDLHLDGRATKEDIKVRFKELVKQHHPDVNGGDEASEEKLRHIISAYNYLKQAGLA